MKNKIKRVCALLLAIMMLMTTLSANVFAGTIFTGTKEDTIYLSWQYYEYDKTNKSYTAVSALEEGKTYAARLMFHNNPADEEQTIVGASLHTEYDVEVVNIPDAGEATKRSVFCKLAASFTPNNDGNGLLIATYATADGFWDDGDIVTDGYFFEARFTAKKAATSEELKTLFKVSNESRMFDVNKRSFTIVECPAFVARVKDGAADFFPTTTAAKIAENLVGEYIDENGNATAVSGITVTLPATGLVEGKNVVTASYNGYTCDVTITVKPDTMTGISITHEPNMSYNSGDKLNLTGLVVSAQYASGNTVELGSGVYATDPAKNTELTVAEHNGKRITVTVGSFTAETTGVLTVSPANISGASIEDVGPFEYTGEQIKPEPAVSLNGKELVKDTDYTLSYDNNTNVTTEAKVIVTAAGTEYTGSAEKTFEITKATGKLTLKVNNEENAVTITYGDSITFTDGNGIAIGGGNPSDVVIYYKTTDESTGTVYDSTSTQLNVGAYTFWAVRSADDNHEAATSNEVVVTIVPRTVTNPALTIEGFAKGSRKSDLTFTNVTANLETPTGYNCYEGTEATGNPDNAGNFKVGTTYSIAITLHPAANYAFDELDPGYLTVTINGEEQKAKIEKGPEFNGVSEYQAVVTATTADKDEPTLDLKDLSATYGDKLLNLKLDSCSASFNGQPVEGTFAWADEYNAETPVGDAGEQTFNVVFTPAQQEVYATVTGTVKVNVAKKQITFTKSDYEWKSINDDPYTLDDYKAMCFQYDKNEHGIEPTCTNNDISDLVEFEVSSNNKSTNVIAATVTAKVLLKDKYAKNYKFDKDNTNIQSATLKVLPIVVEGTGEYAHSVEVCYTTSSVDIPLSAFGLPDEVLNDTNNKYWMRTDAVVAGDVDVISGTPTSFVEATRTLTLNLASLTKDDAGKTASVTLGLKVNNYETTNTGVEEIAGGEEKLFILKLTVKIIEKEDAGLEVFGIPKTMVYGDTVRAGSPDGYYYTVKKEGKNATFSAMISDTAVVAFDDDEGLAAKGVGTATITCTYESDTTFATKTFTINVTPKGLTANVSHDPIIYGDAAPTTGYSVEFEGLVNNDEIAEDAYTVDTEYTKGCKVDNYKFTCVLDTDKIKNYTIGNVTGELVVNPKSIAAPSVTINDPTDKTYTGSPCVQGVSVKDSEAKLTVDDISVTYENNINVGTATIIYTGKNNYTGEIRKNFKITEASITDDMIANIPSVTYNTKPHTPEVTVTFEGSPLEAGKDYDVAYTNNIYAGTATVTVTGKGNFTGTASKNFAIAQAYLSVENQTVTHFRTETDAKSYAVPADMFLADEKETGFTITVTDYDGDEIFTTAPAVNGTNVNYQLNGTVGTAFVEVKVKPDSSNYANASFTLTFVVNDKENVSGSISFPDGSAVYTGTGIKYENATISGYSGTLRYGYTPNASTGASLDASGLPLTVGTYTVAVTFNSDASFGYKTATFTITKATPTGTPGYTKLETSGKTLADAKLTVGTIRPAGTIAWDLPLTTVLEDGKAYAWTFTPADTHNYTILTGTLVPYVDDGMDYIPGVIGGNTGSFNFHDVSRLDYFYDAVKWAAENGIASGTGRYTFSPNAVCTRAQTVTFLWRAAGSPLPRYRVCPFTDVKPSDYYYNAVLWAVEQGITTGLNATTFGPDVTVTRGQVATFLYRAASAAKPSTFNPFTDVKTTAYNYDAILWAYDNRITTGTSDTTFSPDAYCTRAQIVTFLYRYYQGR
ncbi:cell wall/surface repeat protein [Firmicutes bacterium CAG:124]|nr:cell wall/surface repeat protein [Firmicutes bacterium CAG:124]